MAESFDIYDTRNRYEPCPVCGLECGMGIGIIDGALAIRCVCGHSGPPVTVTGYPTPEQDRAAFDGWNTEATRHG